MGTPSNIDEYTLKRLCAENGAFVCLVTIILLSHLTNSTYTTGTHALPDIYACALRPVALGLVHIYQAKHSSLWYK